MLVPLRKLVFIGAGITLALGGLVAIGAGWLLKSQRGRDFVGARVEQLLRGGMHGGHLYLGHLSGSLLGSPRLDSLEIRDTDDSVLVATGPVSLEFDLVDLWDARIAFQNVVIEHPFVHLRNDARGQWNFQILFASNGAPTRPSVGRHLGDVFVVDSLAIHNGTFKWTEPWNPDSALRGLGRDTTIARALARTDIDVKRVKNGYVRARTWRAIEASVPYARLHAPDTSGISLRIAKLATDELDPPIAVRGAAGNVVIANDTVRIDLDTLRLAGSRGSVHGTIATRDGLALALHVVADTVSLADIAWLTPTFPSEGGGRTVLDIRKSPKRDYTEWVLSNMDVQTTRSHLTGAMTFGVGRPMLAVTGVDLGLSPVDFRLFEQFSGKPLSQPWAGQLTGMVRGPGGPLDRFVVDTMAIDFADANVPGVVNQFHGAGEVDISNPALTAFHNFALTAERFDLRTARAIDSAFPPLSGWVGVAAHLDSVWTDIRFRDATIRYVVDSAPESRFSGSGRLTSGGSELTYDLALTADPVSFDALARTYPKLPVRGSLAGPFTLRGAITDLLVTADLTGDAGRIEASDLRFDAVAPLYKASGTLKTTGLDPSALFVAAEKWQGKVNATFDVDLSGDSLANLDGSVRILLGRSTMRGVAYSAGRSRLVFADGLVHTDSLRLSGTGFDARLTGGLGLRRDRRDSLRVTLDVDSLGTIRSWFSPGLDTAVADSLVGAFQAMVRLSGNVDSLDATATATADRVASGGMTSHHVKLDASVGDVTHRRVGTATLQADSNVVGGVTLNGVHVDAQMAGGDSVRVSSHVVSANGPIFDSGANITWDSAGVQTLVDSARLVDGANEWRLARPARIATSSRGVTIDTVDLRTGATGRLTLVAALPESAAIHGNIDASAFPIGEIGRLLQVSLPLSGNVDLTLALAGTRTAPTMNFEVKARDARFGDTRVEGLDAKGTYADRVVNTNLEYRRGGAVAMRGDAHLPMDLSFRSVRKRLLDSPLSGSLDADNTDLAIVETFSNAVSKVTGNLDMHLKLTGTWDKPRLNGKLQIEEGSIGLARTTKTRYEHVHAHINFYGDSVAVDTLTMRSGRGLAQVSGFVKVTALSDPQFNLTASASHFEAINKVGIATPLEVSTPGAPLHLIGKKSSSVLTGGPVEIDGKIDVPETAKKNVLSLDDPDFFRIIDTTVFANRRLLPVAPPAIVQNLRIQGVTVRAGPDLWLKSNEANIKLGGELSVQSATSHRAATNGQRQFSLDGRLVAERGDYRLNLGIVQRTFTVEPGGTVTFFGTDANIDPAIAINALYTVHQYDQHDARQDVRVRVLLGGTLSALTAQLSSPDSLQISRSDLLSYLITGAPSFDIGGRASDYSNTGQRVLVSSLGSVVGSRLSGKFGFDVVDVSTASSQNGYTNVQNALLAGTRVGAGRQWGPTYFHLDAGLCALASADPVAFANGLGLKLDYRLFPSVANGLTLSGGLEPATSALLCSQSLTARGFIPTPRQWGLDLFRTWRF